MKKKANIVLLTVFVFFLCFIFGLLVGRRSASRQVIPKTTFSITTTEPLVTSSSAVADELGKININTASVTLLQSLPDIGPTLAQRIVDYRVENGDFTIIEDLLLVKGIGETRLEKIRQYITVGG